MTYKDIVRAIANAYDTSGLDERYYKEDGTPTVNIEEARYKSCYNPLTKRLRVMFYPHHDTIGSFYLGDD